MAMLTARNLPDVTLAVLLFGIGALLIGKRKAMLAQALDGLMGGNSPPVGSKFRTC